MPFLPPSGKKKKKSAFYGFIRAAGQVFGISIGSSILQNRLNTNLPPQLLERFGGSGDIAFAAIPIIKTLSVVPLSLSL